MHIHRGILIAGALGLSALPIVSPAQRAPYGPPLTLEQAHKVAAVAQARAREIAAPLGVSIAIHDSGCNLVLLERMDNTNLGTVGIAQDKSRSACAFRTDTQVAQQRLTKGGPDGLIFLKLDGLTPIEGGLPIVVNQLTIGSVGVSGGSSAQDAEIAKAASAALQ
ncbi:GlcG/HbpS family heme-binding protein [Cupriavidus basilensis]|uniref:GlcG/HbpS family heme-binding protein n=1 Tax=Cupriavidus basilensis TaxID=68895 RepID=UPI002841D570|nr:heme-binding protein [Cupriavidus basilensis]MDR3384538.1 heme-binding protein [Cupriavidus basilensis]